MTTSSYKHIDFPVSKSDIDGTIPSICHSTESEEHREEKFNQALKHLENGWIVGIEEEIDGVGIIDLIVEKDGIVKAIEVGSVEQRKLNELEEIVDKVEHVGYETEDGIVKCSYERGNNEPTIVNEFFPVSSKDDLLSPSANRRTKGGKKSTSIYADEEYLDLVDKHYDGSISEFVNSAMKEWAHSKEDIKVS